MQQQRHSRSRQPQQQQRLHNQSHGYEEKARAMNFDAETDSGSDSEGERRRRYVRGSRLFVRHREADDGRPHSRVMTHPVVKATTPILATALPGKHLGVRTRPASGTTTTDGGNFSASAARRAAPPSPRWSSQSAVARKAAAAAAPQHTQPQDNLVSRARSSSEVSFGRIPYMGWSRPLYQPSEAAAAAAAAEDSTAIGQQPTEYKGKNLHNFTYADAKIYSPLQLQQQQQQLRRRQQQEQDNRVKIWWTMETMGAVSSGHSNQMMLARGAPAAGW